MVRDCVLQILFLRKAYVVLLWFTDRNSCIPSGAAGACRLLACLHVFVRKKREQPLAVDGWMDGWM